MNPYLAAALCWTGILGLFVIDRDRHLRVSYAIWIPFTWFIIAGSRNVSEWLQSGPPVDGGNAYIEGSPTDRNALAALILLGLIVLFRRGPRVRQLLRSNLPLLAYFLYCLISVAWSDYADVSLKRWIRACGDLVMIFVVLTEEDWAGAVKRLLSRVGFVLLPLSILLILYFSYLGRGYGNDGSVAWTGVTTNKNLLGMISLLTGLAAFWRLIQIHKHREPFRKRLWLTQIVVMAMAGWLLWKAHSATSVACFALAGSVIFLTSQAKFAKKKALVHLVVVSVIFVAFSALFLNLGSSLIEGLGRDSSLTGRTEIWQMALTMVDNPVVGTGYESFWLGQRLARVASIYTGTNQAHNGYLEIYLNLGWIGVFCLATLLITAYFKIIGAVVRQGAMATLLLGYFVVGIAYNFTEGGFKMMHPVWLTFVLAVVGARCAYNDSEAFAPSSSSGQEDELVVRAPQVELSRPLY